MFVGSKLVVVLVFAVNALGMTGTPQQIAAAKAQASSNRVASETVKAALKACTSYPCPAGYTWYPFSDPCAPESPDTYEAYVEYWNENETFAYDVYAGHATYYRTDEQSSCQPLYQPSTVGSSGAYLDCINNSPWNCPQLGVSGSPHP
jgi:hypothetical protein